MNRNLKKTIYISLMSVLLLLILLLVSINNASSQPYPINDLRIHSNDIYIDIQGMWADKNYDFDDIAGNGEHRGIYITVIDLHETVIFSNSQYFNAHSVPIMQEALYMDASYQNKNPNVIKLSQPLYLNGMINGFVIFEKEYEVQPEADRIRVVLGVTASVIVCLLIVLYGISLFKKNNSEFIAIEKGLTNITKGMLAPIDVNKSSQYPQIYHTYNMLVKELKYMMEQREYNQEQRKSFLTTISHELKTPVSTISAYVEGLKNGIADDDEKRKQYINIIYDKMQMLTKLIEDFFLYTQEDEDKFKYNFVECYADELIEDVFSSIASQKGNKTTYKNLLPKCIVKLDKFRIEQVILNLYNNAKKHTTDNQSILLSAYREDDDIVILVSDDGAGISPKDLPYIFDYYYQGIASKTKDYQGVGLGLAISKNIIEAHKGKMKVKSTEGSGTNMYVYIPIV